MDCYDDLGVKKRINAWDTVSSIGGSRMKSEVMEAYFSAEGSETDIDDFCEYGGEEIAKALQVEAACITGGASAGLLTAACACMSGGRSEFVIQCGHRNHYDCAVRLAGGKIVQIGIMWGTEEWELRGALSPRTAAMLFCAAKKHMDRGLPLKTCAEITHGFGIPLIVDAAAQIPPLDNLYAYLSDGADAVMVSGGKALGGPQSCGFAIGTRKMISEMNLAMRDCRNPSFLTVPGHGPAAALVRAVKLAAEKGFSNQLDDAERMASFLSDQLNGEISHVTPNGLKMPRVLLACGEKAGRIKAKLKADGIEVGIENGKLSLNPWDLSAQEAEWLCRYLEAKNG